MPVVNGVAVAKDLLRAVPQAIVIAPPTLPRGVRYRGQSLDCVVLEAQLPFPVGGPLQNAFNQPISPVAVAELRDYVVLGIHMGDCRQLAAWFAVPNRANAVRQNSNCFPLSRPVLVPHRAD